MRLPASLCLLLVFVIFTWAQTASTAAADGWVVLPVNEYTALKNAASTTEPEPPAPPVEATLSRIDYQLKIDGDLSEFHGAFCTPVNYFQLQKPELLKDRPTQFFYM